MAWEFPRDGGRREPVQSAWPQEVATVVHSGSLPPTVAAERLTPFYLIPPAAADPAGTRGDAADAGLIFPHKNPDRVRGLRLRTGVSGQAGPSSPLARGATDATSRGLPAGAAERSATARSGDGPGGAPAGSGGPPEGEDADRWYLLQPRRADGFHGPPAELAASRPPVVAEEEGRWVTLQPKRVPADAPHVRAASPWRLERAAKEAAQEEARARGRVPGAPTPWPEQDGRWHTYSRDGPRVAEPWEAPPEAGTYDEWSACLPEDCVRPRAYDSKPRWYELPGTDDGRKPSGPLPEVRSGAIEAAEAAAVAAGRPAKPFAWAVNEKAPPEDSAHWYTVPNLTRVGPAPQWREC